MKLVFLFVFLVIFLSVGVVAQEGTKCNDPTEIMFAISSNGNAHIEDNTLINNYAHQICFYDYFQRDGTIDQVHGGRLLRISDTSNAHATGPDVRGPYASYITFSDFVCDLDPNSYCKDFKVGGKQAQFIVTLSDQSNAHVAKGGFYDPSISDAVSLCCSSERADGLCNPNDDICDHDGGETDNNCPQNCPESDCGNSIEEGGEECDDGDIDGEGTENYGDCIIDPTPGGIMCQDNVCGDGYVGTGEDCDEGSNNGFGNCPIGCSFGGGPTTSGDCNQWYTEDGKLSRIESCRHYNFVSGDKEEECELDCVGAASLDAQRQGGLGSCGWEEGECKFFYKHPDTGAQCKITYGNAGVCSEGSVTRTIEYTSTSLDGGNDNLCECDEGDTTPNKCTKDVLCPKVLQLPMFGALQFITSLVIIGLLYTGYLLRRR